MIIIIYIHKNIITIIKIIITIITIIIIVILSLLLLLLLLLSSITELLKDLCNIYYELIYKNTSHTCFTTPLNDLIKH